MTAGRRTSLASVSLARKGERIVPFFVATFDGERHLTSVTVENDGFSTFGEAERRLHNSADSLIGEATIVEAANPRGAVEVAYRYFTGEALRLPDDDDDDPEISS